MKQYDDVRATIPADATSKRAHIIGGGIAGLAAAVFLIDDGGMLGQNITIYESLPVVGGSMDGTKIQTPYGFGYQNRGERELEPYMECLWYLCKKIPSIDTPGRTVLEETVTANKDDQIDSKTRVLWQQGKSYEKVHDFRTSPALQKKMMALLTTSEADLVDMTVDDFFGKLAPEFYSSSLWICFHSMLAFKNYHSVLEVKRYLIRFIQHNPGIDRLQGILHTKYNEFDSIIKPIRAWLLDCGVTMRTNFHVDDINMTDDNNTATAIVGTTDGQQTTVPVDSTDLVILTNGSMTQNSSYGDNTHVAATNRDTEERGVFSIWEKLAARDAKFGQPAKFLSDVDKTKWMSVLVTVKKYPEFYKQLYAQTHNTVGKTTGCITIQDSAWDISFVCYPKYYPDQADDEDVFFFDGLYGENKGDYVKKPMADCTGEEILTEFLYHLGLLDLKDEMLKHVYISTCMMPYITSQFMPRNLTDRPHVIPEGVTNLALIGQYVELPGDVVFTVETSVRTAMIAAYGLLKLDKPVVPIYEGQYDVRVLVACLRKFIGKDTLTVADLPKINPLKLNATMDELLAAINAVPEIAPTDNVY